MRPPDEKITASLQRRLDRVQASSELWGRIELGMNRSRRRRRIEAALIGVMVLASSGVVLARMDKKSSSGGSVALAPGESTLPSALPSIEPSPTPSATTSSPTPGPTGMIHFVSPGGDLEFDYPEGWVADPGATARGGVFYSREHPDEERRPGDMKLDFAINENTKKEDLDDLQARDCTLDPSIEAEVDCDQRQINGRIWVWSAAQMTEAFDRSYVIWIGTIVDDRIYQLIAYIMRGEDVSEERIGFLQDILDSAQVNA